MLNILSILIGGVALAVAIPGFVPFLGWLNWGMIPIAALGAVVGVFSSRTAGRNFNLILILVGAVRLFLGGGIL